MAPVILQKTWIFLRSLSMIVWTIVAALLGTGFGIMLSFVEPDELVTHWLGMLGSLFIRALTLMVVPLVFCSIILGVAGIVDIGGSVGKLGLRTVGFYTLTTIVAVLEGLAFVQSFKFAWNTGFEEEYIPIYTNPSSAIWDETARVSIINLEHVDEFFTLATAALVSMKFAGESALTNVTSLVYNEARTISFRLPDLLPSGSVSDISVFDSNGALNFVVPNGSLSISSGVSDTEAISSGESISNSITNLLTMVVPRNAFGTFVGLPNNSASLLGMITFALCFAIALTVLKRKNSNMSNALIDTIRQVLDVILLMTQTIMKITPFAVFSLIVQAIGQQSIDELAATMQSLGVLFGTVLFAFAFHAIVFLGLLLFLFTRKNIFVHYKQVSPALSLAFASASSASTLPVTIDSCQNNVGVSEHVSKFVLSLGAALNMDANAIFQPAIIIWLAYTEGIAVTFADQIIICIVAALASMGASPAPGLTPAVILVWSAVFPQYPVPEAIAYVMALDWLLDRCITSINVGGDTVVASMIDTLNDKHNNKMSAKFMEEGKQTGSSSDDENEVTLDELDIKIVTDKTDLDKK
eukprot:Awhi_evm1s9429